MIASRFTKAFQLTALVLVFSVAQVYVMAGPLKVSTDPKATDPSTTSQPKSETAATAESTKTTAAATTISAASQMLIPGVASERMPLTAGSKTTLNHIFSKRDVEARIATGSTFLKAKASFAESFKSPGKHMSSPQSDDSGSDDDKDSRGVWIAVGVIAAVLTVAIIGLRHDRHSSAQ